MRMLVDRLAGDGSCSQWQAVRESAPKLGGVGNELLRRWCEQHLVNTGERQGLTCEEHEDVKLLKRENSELRRANEILKNCFGFFRSAARPTGPMMIAYIDEYKDRFGVEPICRTLGGG